MYPRSTVLLKKRPWDMKEPFIILKTFVTIEKWTFTPPNDFLSTELTKQALFSV